MTHIIDKKPNVIVRLLKGTVPLLKEIADFYRFFWKTSKSEKVIVFFSEHQSYYPYFEGIIEKLINEHKQTLCYITSSSDDPILQKSEPKIKTFYLYKLLPIFMTFVSCKVFVMTMTNLNQFYLKRSIKPVHYVYVFHSLVSTHMIYRYGAFDHYDSILCVGPHHVKEIRKHEKLNNLSEKKLVEAGYYRLERVYEACQKYSSNKTTKKMVLIAPSWGVANILESCGERLVGLLLDEGYKVIVRPHPETIKRSPDIINLFATKFDNNPDFTLETSIATDDSMLKADVLISDYSGIALEYAFGTDQPVLFLDVPTKITNQRYKELGIEPLELSIRKEIGVIISPKKLETVPQVVSKLIANKATYKKRIEKLRDHYVYAFRHSSEVGAKYIIDLAMGKND
ncbi:MAG: CDP-glycerol glycerophosphotransferase family protein [Nanoarchaeota archaeon]|nr:CDP-glycerol glycerophosphotransferase family protein [Nanoarchaeota archaeon]